MNSSTARRSRDFSHFEKAGSLKLRLYILPCQMAERAEPTARCRPHTDGVQLWQVGVRNLRKWFEESLEDSPPGQIECTGDRGLGIAHDDQKIDSRRCRANSTSLLVRPPWPAVGDDLIGSFVGQHHDVELAEYNPGLRRHLLAPFIYEKLKSILIASMWRDRRRAVQRLCKSSRA